MSSFSITLSLIEAESYIENNNTILTGCWGRLWPSKSLPEWRLWWPNHFNRNSLPFPSTPTTWAVSISKAKDKCFWYWKVSPTGMHKSNCIQSVSDVKTKETVMGKQRNPKTLRLRHKFRFDHGQDMCSWSAIFILPLSVLGASLRQKFFEPAQYCRSSSFSMYRWHITT